MDHLAEQEAFLRAIFDAPDDDTPRLVYADFLEEHGEPERAEFIRVQCELARLPAVAESTARADQLIRRQDELLASDRPGLRRLDLFERDQHRYVRGFQQNRTTIHLRPDELSDPQRFRRRAVEEDPHWFGCTVLFLRPGGLLLPEHVGQLLAYRALQQITEWNLGGHVEEVADGPQTEDAGTFALIDMNVQPVITLAGVEALAQHRGAWRITSLDLTFNNLDNDAARALIRSPYLDNLKRLDFRDGNNLRGRVWQQLIERFGENVVG
jgi:uncharacterized protein (TIGR02996 family)